MNKSNISLDELAEIYGVKKDQSSWYFWSQHRDITLRDEFKVLLNYKINQKELIYIQKMEHMLKQNH